MTKPLPLTFDSLKEHFLLATPALNRGFFAQSITYICEHTEEGAMGIVINQPLEVAFEEVLGNLNIDYQEGSNQETIFAGGPVQMDHGFILHREKGNWETSESVGNNIWLTTSQDILTAIATGSGPRSHLIALGYAGWGPGQLEEELMESSWLTIKADADILFDIPYPERLIAAGEKLGIDISLMSSQTGHA